MSGASVIQTRRRATDKKEGAELKKDALKTTKLIYDNSLILDDAGKPLCRCSRKRAEYYLNKELAFIVEDKDHLIIQLLFAPAGPGNRNDPYLIRPLDNRCVVCGKEEDLTRHHVVPYQYRKWFPQWIGYLTNFDILALCLNCHKAYETRAKQFTKELEKEFAVPETILKRPCDPTIQRLLSHAGALLYYLGSLPQSRIAECLQTLRDYYGRPGITRNDLVEALSLDPHVHNNDDNFTTAGEYIVSKLFTLEDFNEFTRRWREHFLKIMRPQYLDENWVPDRGATGKRDNDPELSAKRQRRKSPHKTRAQRLARRREMVLTKAGR